MTRMTTSIFEISESLKSNIEQTNSKKERASARQVLIGKVPILLFNSLAWELSVSKIHSSRHTHTSCYFYTIINEKP